MTRYERIYKKLSELKERCPENLRLCGAFYNKDGSDKKDAQACACKGCVHYICNPSLFLKFMSGELKQILIKQGLLKEENASA